MLYEEPSGDWRPRRGILPTIFIASLVTACARTPENPDGTGGSAPFAGSGGVAGADTGGTSGAGAGGSGSGEWVTANQAAATMGKGFNIGNTFDVAQQPMDAAAIAKKIDAYYAKGFRNMRLPITWTEAIAGTTLVSDANVGAVDRQHPRLQLIRQVVDYALSKPDLSVVINAHHEKGLKTQNAHAVLERLWQDIAEIFRDRGPRLMYEILNEPHKHDLSPMAPEDLRNMTEKAYKKIRAVDPKRIVIIGGNQWFAAEEMQKTWPSLDQVGGGQDKYIMATFHHYAPWTFCGDNQGDYADAWTDQNIAAPMEIMREWATSAGKGMPVYIGEWGVGWGSRYPKMECNNIRLWYQKFDKDNAAPKGMPTAVWDDGGWFQIFNSMDGVYANNLADCIVGDCEWTGTERLNAGCK